LKEVTTLTLRFIIYPLDTVWWQRLEHYLYGT